jgi:uncharacterized protein YjbI with pentapeptide repeats
VTLRFEGQRICFGGKLAVLRKDEVARVLTDEGAVIADKLGPETTLLVSTTPGSVNEKRATKLGVAIVSEDELRRRLLPTPDEALAMLLDKGGKRLANLLELNRKPYMRSTDEYSTIRLVKRSLRGAKLSNASLCGVVFVDCDLTGADLTEAKWLAEAKRVDFRSSTAKECELVEATDCDFRDADLTGATMRDMTNCRFENAKLAKSRMSDKLSACRFDGAKLDGFEASYAKLRDCSFATASLQKATIVNSTVKKSSFAGADLRGASLRGDSDPAVFESCDFRDADFRGAVIAHVRFVGCDLAGARFDDAKVVGLELDKTDASKATGLDASPVGGGASKALETAAPTFKNITVTVTLKLGAKKVECTLYQFDHSANPSCRQAWLGKDNVGALTITDAITTIAKLNPGAKLDEKSLVVKATKGKKPPSLKPKELERAVLAAWQEALQ